MAKAHFSTNSFDEMNLIYLHKPEEMKVTGATDRLKSHKGKILRICVEVGIYVEHKQ